MASAGRPRDFSSDPPIGSGRARGSLHLGYLTHKCPCNWGSPMTPNQLRLRASSHKDLSTTNSLGFAPDFNELETPAPTIC